MWFTFVFLFDVLEHIARPVDFLKACAFHLRPGGYLIINVPAMPWLYSAYDEANGHVKRYRKNDLMGELEMAGMDNHFAVYWGFFMIPLAYIRKWMPSKNKTKGQIIASGFQVKNKLFNRLLKAVCGIEKYMFTQPPIGTSLMAVARKKEQ